MRSVVKENAHFLADGFTLYRFLASSFIIYGIFHHMDAGKFSLVVIAAMLSDIFDGVIARKYGGTSLGSLDYPADLALVASMGVFFLQKHFLPFLPFLMYTLFLFLLTLLFRNDSPVAFWMGSIYASFLFYAYRYSRSGFVGGLVTVILAVAVNPGRAREKIMGFLMDVRRGIRGG